MHRHGKKLLLIVECMKGNGKMTYANGTVYEGELKD